MNVDYRTMGTNNQGDFSAGFLDLPKARRVAERLRAGSCAINDVIKTIGNPYLPFGGVKQSGFGRYHGPDGLSSTQVPEIGVDDHIVGKDALTILQQNTEHLPTVK